MTSDEQDASARATAAVRWLSEAGRFYREDPEDMPTIENLGDAYQHAVSEGLAPDQIEQIVGMSVTEIKQITWAP